MPRFTFGSFCFDSTSGELFRDGSRVPIPNKAAAVLERLLAHPGELVTREQLRNALWAADTFVDFDNNLNAAVRKLREAFGDDAAHPRFIQTLPRRGYRFIPIVHRESPAVPLNQVDREQSPVSILRAQYVRPWRGWMRFASLAIVSSAMVLLQFDRAAHIQPAPVIAVRRFDNLSGDAAQSHISKGLETELATQLARRGRYRVQALGRIDRGPGSEEVGAAPDFVVEGSARADSAGLFVTVRLLESRAHTYVWAGSFHCPMGDSPAIQRQVASKVAEAIGSPSTN